MEACPVGVLVMERGGNLTVAGTRKSLLQEVKMWWVKRTMDPYRVEGCTYGKPCDHGGVSYVGEHCLVKCHGLGEKG